MDLTFINPRSVPGFSLSIHIVEDSASPVTLIIFAICTAFYSLSLTAVPYAKSSAALPTTLVVI